MKAIQLRDALNRMFEENPDSADFEVATSSDPEGNGFHQLSPQNKFEKRGMVWTI